MVTDTRTKSDLVRTLIPIQIKILLLMILKKTKIPNRSKSHPLQHHERSGHKCRKSEAFDPDELCRRLEVLRRDLRESQRRRREPAVKHVETELYHHTPQVAARDFANTTTPHSLKDKDIHKLSRSVLKKYKHGPEYKAPTADDLQQHLGRVNHDMEVLAERNQFQRTPALESAARIDRTRNGNNVTLQNLSNPNPSSNSHVDILQPSRLDEENVGIMSNIDTAFYKTLTHHPENRNDWTQRDECEEIDKRVLKYLTAPLFRRTAKNNISEKESSNSKTELNFKN